MGGRDPVADTPRARSRHPIYNAGGASGNGNWTGIKDALYVDLACSPVHIVTYELDCGQCGLARAEILRSNYIWPDIPCISALQGFRAQLTCRQAHLARASLPSRALIGVPLARPLGLLGTPKSQPVAP